MSDLLRRLTPHRSKADFLVSQGVAMSGDRERGELIQATRRERGWTMGDVARKLGVSVSAVSAVEVDRNPDPKTRLRIEKLLELAPPPPRLLVFGSRGFGGPVSEPGIVESSLARLLRDDDTLMHGACNNSPDERASLWCAAWHPGNIEAYAADWSRGPKAGPERNSVMAARLQPGDAWLGFWDGQSRGTLDMLKKAAARPGVTGWLRVETPMGSKGE